MPDFQGHPPFSYLLRAAKGRDGRVYVAWLWTRYVNQSEEEQVLEVCRLEDESCVEKQVISRKAAYFVWANGPSGACGLMMQEYDRPLVPSRGRNVDPVYFAPITEQGLGSTLRIADAVPEAMFRAAVDSDGVFHLVHVAEATAGHFFFVHRWASVSSN